MLMKMSLETFNIVISMLSSKSQLQAVCRGAVVIQADTLVFLLVFKWFSKKIPVTQEQKKEQRKEWSLQEAAGKELCQEREEAGEGMYRRNEESISGMCRWRGKRKCKPTGPCYCLS